MRNKRFEILKYELARALGVRLELLANGRVLVCANEFSPAWAIHSVQGAVDHFARFLPASLTDENYQA